MADRVYRLGPELDEAECQKVSGLVYEAFQTWKTNNPKLECVHNGQELVPHHNADGSLRHYCTAEYCPDLQGRTA